MEETAGEDREKSEVEPSTFLPADITEVSDPVEAGLPDIKQEGKIWVTYDITGRQIENDISDENTQFYSSADGTQPEVVWIDTFENGNVLIGCAYGEEGNAYYGKAYRLTEVEEYHEGYDEATFFEQDTLDPILKEYRVSHTMLMIRC